MTQIKKYQNAPGAIKKRPFWQNAIMGAAVAEAPAVMTASGWYQDQNGDWQQDPEREGLDELRSALTEIGIQGVATLTGEALVAAAAKYAPTVLAKVGPKLHRFKRTITGETAAQANRVRIQGNLMLSDVTQAANKSVLNSRKGTGQALSTLRDVNGNRMGWINENGMVFDANGNSVFSAAEYSPLWSQEINNAKRNAQVVHNYITNGSNSAYKGISTANQAIKTTSDLKDISKGAVVAGVGTAAGVAGLNLKQGGTLNYLDYII